MLKRSIAIEVVAFALFAFVVPAQAAAQDLSGELNASSGIYLAQLGVKTYMVYVHYDERISPTSAWMNGLRAEIYVQARTEITVKNAAVKQFKDNIPRHASNLYRNIKAGYAFVQ